MKENREGIVQFEEISGAVMEDVLEFIYTRRGSRILKWWVNFCNNVIEPINICGIRRKEGERENKQRLQT